MKLYQFKTNLSRLEYQGIAFNNAYTGFNKDYSRLTEFIYKYNINIKYKIGESPINRIMFDDSLGMSHKEIRQYFNKWSAINMPKNEIKPKLKKKVS